MFAVHVLLLRQRIILKKLKACGAMSEASAKTLKEAGVFNPNAFPKVTENLVKQNKLVKTETQKYYFNQ